jgi:hypothetical protein
MDPRRPAPAQSITVTGAALPADTQVAPAARTGRLVAWMMKAMYDAGVNPLIEKLEAQQR